MKKHIIAIILQFFVCFAASLIVFVLRPVSVLHGILKWVALPALGASSAFILGRRGLNPYLCWIMPPIALTIAAIITAMGYFYEGGALIADILACIVGAAASEVYNKTNRKTKQKGRK